MDIEIVVASTCHTNITWIKDLSSHFPVDLVVYEYTKPRDLVSPEFGPSVYSFHGQHCECVYSQTPIPKSQ